MRTADDVLAHYGVKGMKWGVRKSEHGGASAGSVSSRAAAKVNATKTAIKKDISERTAHETTVRTKPGQMVRVVGGNKHTPHTDAINARVSEQIAKKNTLDALSNKDLQHLVNRMNLEAQYRNLAVKETRKSAGEKAVGQLLASKHADVALAKLGPHAALGKKVVNLGFNQATRNKGLEGGKIKDDKKKDK
jgi:hypothetical protein